MLHFAKQLTSSLSGEKGKFCYQDANIQFLVFLQQPTVAAAAAQAAAQALIRLAKARSTITWSSTRRGNGHHLSCTDYVL